MDFSEREIGQLIENVWLTMLGWEVETVEVNPSDRDEFLIGSIPINGAWSGVVKLHCHRALVRDAATVIFQLPEAELTAELVHDALGELTNIVGGNLKALFNGKCYLGLPTVASGDKALECEPVLGVSFRSRGWPLCVEVCTRQLAAV